MPSEMSTSLVFIRDQCVGIKEQLLACAVERQSMTMNELLEENAQLEESLKIVQELKEMCEKLFSKA